MEYKSSKLPSDRADTLSDYAVCPAFPTDRFPVRVANRTNGSKRRLVSQPTGCLTDRPEAIESIAVIVQTQSATN
ncbi:hypothetical protein ZHAS_00006752 [Anopheles sinensis]|uniref:Uncharacterized protein n=1 Tax=Anopheles sinensis TaxID=74873 RepID=A0A084VM47_ANOSI|nr:hypothetical protein ZHAS_00006752 [Anopheles sinensis]